VGIWVPSPYHLWLSRSVPKSRPIGSGARHRARPYDVEVLRPQHRRRVRCEHPECGVTAGEGILEQPGGLGVDLDLLVGFDLGSAGVHVVEAAGLDAGRGGEFAVAARESQGTGLRDERVTIDAEVGPGDGSEATGYDTKLDATAMPILRTREHQLGDAVQGAPGHGQ
jgi:hypothetical protein